MKRILFVMGILGISFIGCKRDTTGNIMSYECINIAQTLVSPVKLSTLFDKTKFVKLETSSENLLSDIRKVFSFEDLIVIGSGKSIFLFDQNGKFINKIDRTGNGPEEYTRLSDFDINYSKREIAVLDKGLKQILFYDFEGNYIRNILFDFWAVKLKYLSDDKYLLYSGNETSDNQDGKFTILTSEGVECNFHKIDKNKSNYLHVNGLQNFYKNKDELLFNENFNDTIYSKIDTVFIPKYVFSYDNMNIPKVFFEKSYANIMEFFQALHKTDYAYGISSFMETDENIYIGYQKSGLKHYAFYNKKNKNSNVFTSLVDDLSFTDVELPLSEEDFSFWPYQGKIMYFLESDWLMSHQDKIKSDQLKSLCNELSIDDNPVLVVNSLK